MRAPPVSLRSTLTASCFATALTGTFLSACHDYPTAEDILGVPTTQVTAAVGPAFVPICHVRGHGVSLVMTVPQPAVANHLAHGDALGACAPRLLSPAEATLLPQNNASSECTLHPTRGYGLKIIFDWTPPRDPRNTVTGYQLFAKNVDAPLPIIDAVVGTPPYVYVNCNAFVDAFLLGWQWMVRARDSSGNFGPWTPAVNFGFQPCRLQDGSPCRTTP